MGSPTLASAPAPVHVTDHATAQFPGQPPYSSDNKTSLPHWWPSAGKTCSSDASQQSHHAACVTSAHSTWTCRMIRNIPNDYTRDDFVELLDANAIQYNFL